MSKFINIWNQVILNLDMMSLIKRFKPPIYPFLEKIMSKFKITWFQILLNLDMNLNMI